MLHIAQVFSEFYIKEWFIDNEVLPHNNRGIFGVYDTNQQQIQLFGGYYDSSIQHTYNIFDSEIKYNQTLTNGSFFKNSGQTSTMYFLSGTLHTKFFYCIIKIQNYVNSKVNHIYFSGMVLIHTHRIISMYSILNTMQSH